eukprot:scaffold83869_cov45-Cyclotella_meneghiniana.AAC.7
MDVICATDLFPKSDWRAINRVRKYKGVHSLADIVLCDGRTLDPWVLTTEGSDSTHVFSVEKPTRSDFATFRRAVTYLTLPTHRLQSPLGAYVNKLHRRDDWFISEDQTLLFRSMSDSSYIQYTRNDSVRNTRFAISFSNPTAISGQFPRSTRASVQLLHGDSDVRVVLWHGLSVHLRIDCHSWSVYGPNPIRLSGEPLLLMVMDHGFMRVC